MLISIILPFYNEEEIVDELYGRLVKVFENNENDFEVIAVNDGSKDATFKKLKEYALKDKRLRVIDFSRNFGHQIAISAGISFSNGAAAIIIDADLQDPPELIPELIKKWKEGYEVVYGVREKRKEGIFKRICYSLFYKVLRSVANIDIPLDSGDFCLMDKKVVDILKNIPERNRFIRGIRCWIGFRQIGFKYERDVRYAGVPKYTFIKLIKLAFDGIVSFSHFPLRIASTFGFLISIITFLIGLFLIIKRLVYGTQVYGLTTIIIAVLFLGGIQLVTIGIIGEYIGRIYDEVKQRPIFIIKELVNFNVNNK
jgi:dolichol-phosphate mannosyltransferase